MDKSKKKQYRKMFRKIYLIYGRTIKDAKEEGLSETEHQNFKELIIHLDKALMVISSIIR